MSTQSIISKDCENIRTELESVFVCMGKSYFMKKYFMVGEGYNREDFIRLNKLGNLFCSDNCSFEKQEPYIREEIRKITLKY